MSRGLHVDNKSASYVYLSRCCYLSSLSERQPSEWYFQEHHSFSKLHIACIDFNTNTLSRQDLYSPRSTRNYTSVEFALNELSSSLLDHLKKKISVYSATF